MNKMLRCRPCQIVKDMVTESGMYPLNSWWQRGKIRGCGEHYSAVMERKNPLNLAAKVATWETKRQCRKSENSAKWQIHKLAENGWGRGHTRRFFRLFRLASGASRTATCISFLGRVAFKLSRVARPSPFSFHNHHPPFQSLHLPPRHLRLESYALTRSYTVVRRIK